MIPASKTVAIALLLLRRALVSEGWTARNPRTFSSTRQHASPYCHSSPPPVLQSSSPFRPCPSSANVLTLKVSTSASANEFSDPTITDITPESVEPVSRTPSSPTTSTASLDSRSLPFPLVVWKFSRPHTLIGSAVAIPALHCLAAPQLASVVTLRTMKSILYAMLPALLMNIYITGLNQITDVEIDRINKPYLVLPAGIMSRRSAIATVVVCLVSSLVFGHVGPMATSGLAFALWGSALLGTLYSLPPFRLKRFPLLAAFCIVAVRGTIINASFFAHATEAAFGGVGGVLQALRTSRACGLSSLFYCVFGVVIALMKDVPDVSGDLKSNVRTFSVRLGQEQVFHASRRLLTGLFWAFGVGFARSAWLAPTWSSLQLGRTLVAVAALFAGTSVRRQSRNVNPTDSPQVYTYYMHLWKLFYASYLALPWAR